MNKKEISEIKKQFTPDRCCITRICGCYVDGEKNKKTELKEAFLSLSEEEAFKYFEIFKKTLSGTIGKNLINMEFPLEQEKEGGTQEFLLKLRGSKLQDPALLEEFYDKIIQFYDYGENYYIILIHAVYDIPGKSLDGSEMFDASEDVYEYLLCSICPVKLSKPGLSYHAEDNTFGERVRDWIVEMPDIGFLFPAFNDRSTDLHSILYYTKNAEELRASLVENLLGAILPLSAGGQKETFQTLIEETLGEERDYEVVKNIHENLYEMLEEKKDSPEPVTLDKTEVKKLFAHSGVTEEHLEDFDRNFEQATSSSSSEQPSFLATNIVNTRKFEIRTPDVVINVNPERSDLVETRIIDGRRCIVIGIDDHVEINGISVKAVAKNQNEIF